MSDYADLELDPQVLFGQIEADSAFAPSPESPPGVDAEAFLAAMRVLAGGVVMVTARADDRVWGLTISSCCSVSAQPPQVLISLAHGSSARPVVLATGRFGVSILRGHQKPLAELGAVPGGPKHVDAFCEGREGSQTTTMLAGALYHLDCRVGEVFDVSDHTLVVGVVEAAVPGAGAEDDLAGPLVYFNRTFHTLGRPIA